MPKTYSKNEKDELLETETKEEVHTYSLDFLTSQKATLESELAKVVALIGEAKKVGLKVKEII